MKALVFTDLGKVEVLDVPEVVAQDGDVVVEVERAGICGSELHGISTPGFRVPPLVMGHEFIGRAPDGRRVAVNPLISCGQCDRCRAGHPQLCRTRALLGVHRAGGFAERVAVPPAQMHDLPAALSPERAALIEPVANAVHAWALAGSPAGQRVGIVGAGPIGLACVEVARHEGAVEVLCVDLAKDRRDVAERLGASVADSLEGEFDVVVDAVGSAPTRRAAINHTVPGGTSVWLGLASGEPGFDGAALVRLEKTVRGSFAYTDQEFARAIEMASALDLSWATTYPLAEGAEIFTALMGGLTTPIKALLEP
jgi:threonine dehydrogenase-like Zn-dependent dehydrogenase